MTINLKYIGQWFSSVSYFRARTASYTHLRCCSSTADPTYMIRAIPSNASDNVYCTLLAHSVVHGAMAGYTGFTIGQVNGRHCYIPFYVSHTSAGAGHGILFFYRIHHLSI
jgi:6-phosphofructokinase